VERGIGIKSKQIENLLQKAIQEEETMLPYRGS
jgi:hypothetical protein